MNFTERCVVLLVERLHPGQNTQPLIGDLLEERRSGRSRYWLIYQAIAAVAGALARDIAGHKVNALRAIAIGCVVVMAWPAFTRRFPAPAWADGPFLVWTLTACAFVLACAAIAHTFPKHRAAMVSAFAVFALLAKLCLITGALLLHGAGGPL